MVAWSLFACFVPFLHLSSDKCVHIAHPSVVEGRRTFSRLGLIPDGDILASVREGIAESSAESNWNGSVEALADLAGMDGEEAEHCLADGLNWKAWAKASPMMRKYAKPIKPDSDRLVASLRWLREGPLELDVEELKGAIRHSPKVYLTSPKESYEKALAAAPEKYKDHSVFRDLILKDPSVLDCYYNCDIADEGCASECGNCWVAFERR